MGWFTKKERKSELTLAIENLKLNPSANNQKAFAKILASYVENGTWVPMPIFEDKIGYRLKIVQSQGKHFAAMCSDSTHVKRDPEFNVAVTDINKLIEPVFENSDIDGIIINPYTTCLCLEKDFLLKCLLHAKYPKQNNAGSPPRDWGAGIPLYSDSDLMTEGEKQNFALHTVLNNDKYVAENYYLISACDHPAAIPNLILQSDTGFAFAYIKGYTSLTEPTLTDDEKEEMLLLGKKYNAETYFATVGFLSTDP